MSLLLSLFCPLCEYLYDKTNKRPRYGICRHNVWHACIESSGNGKCPICNEKDAFTDVLYSFRIESMIKRVEQLGTEELPMKLAANPNILDIECKGPDCKATAGLQVCVTCAKGLKLFKLLPNGRIKVLEQNRMLFFAKVVLLCSNCMSNSDHRSHCFLPLSKFNAIGIRFEFRHIAIYTTLLE